MENKRILSKSAEGYVNRNNPEKKLLAALVVRCTREQLTRLRKLIEEQGIAVEYIRLADPRDSIMVRVVHPWRWW